MLDDTDDDRDTPPVWNGVQTFVNGSLVVLIAAMLLWWPVGVAVEMVKQKWPMIVNSVQDGKVASK